MKYCITMERTQRVAVWFDAPNDEKAEKEADRIFGAATAADFEDGDEERDYALDNVDK